MPRIKLGQFLRQSTDVVKIDHPEQEKYITVLLYGRGVTERTIKEGKTPVAFTGYRAHCNQLIVSTINARHGAIGVVPCQLDGAVVSKDFPLFDIDRSKVDHNYLLYALWHDSFVRQADALSFGATMPRLHAKPFLNMDIELPSLDQQKLIANQIQSVESLVASREKQLAKLDELIKSRFIELFGDPELNPNGWKTTTIGAVIQSCEAGWSGNGTQREKKPGEIAVLKVSAVTKGFFVPEECKVLDNQNEIKKYVFPQKGDLLFSRANTREMVGATAVIFQDYPELILPDKLWKIRFYSRANVLYMKHILSHKSIRSKFSEASTGTSGSMFNVSMEKFKAIEIPLPPIERQEQFAAFVEQTDKSKLAIQESLAELETLKKALMQKYFG